MGTAEYIAGSIMGYATVVVILATPVALMFPRSRRWLLRPVTRRIRARRRRSADRRQYALAMEQARRDARTAELQAELDKLDCQIHDLG